MVCLESLINGLPVIATRCGGPEEIIDHGLNGLLVENRNVSEMQKAMVTMYENIELRSRMIVETSRVINKFSIFDSAQKLSSIYTGL